MLILVSAVTVHAQTQAESTSQTTPQGQWTVHKQYDEKGNLISKDSTYTYSSINGKAVSPQEADSLWQDIRKRLPDQFASSGFFDQIDSETMSEFLNGFDSDLINGLLNDFNSGHFDDLLQGFNLEEMLEDFDQEEWSGFMKDFDFESFDASSLQDLLKDEDLQKLMEKHQTEIEKFMKKKDDFSENSTESKKKENKNTSDIQIQKI